VAAKYVKRLKPCLLSFIFGQSENLLIGLFFGLLKLLGIEGNSNWETWKADALERYREDHQLKGLRKEIWLSLDKKHDTLRRSDSPVPARQSRGSKVVTCTLIVVSPIVVDSLSSLEPLNTFANNYVISSG
jgi:hypothetical protein